VEEKTTFLVALGRRVRGLRQAHGLTQEQLAERAGLSAKYVSGIENGSVNASVGVLHDIAAHGFRLSLPALLSFSLEADEAARLRDEVLALIESQPPDARRRALRALDAFFGPAERPER
jgi:transcriptional regulator with XRE-family HTH domain